MAIQTDRGRLREGRLVRWDPAKGFGFIRPAEGGQDVFLHVSALPQGQAPGIGARIVFSAVDDPQGRGPRALKAIPDATDGQAAPTLATQARPSGARTPARPRPPRPAAPKPGPHRGPAATRPKRRDKTLEALPFNALTLVVAAATLCCLWGAATALPFTPLPLAAYPIFSVVAFLLYARDKFSAINGHWRIRESSLHLAEALGGWPGAFVAQQTMRHKTAKKDYQIGYWLIVAAHLGAWGLWAFDPGLVRAWLSRVH